MSVILEEKVVSDKPLNILELRQVEQGISLFMRQPSQGPRLLVRLLRSLNASLDRITELEMRLDELESKSVKRTPDIKKKTSPADDI